MSQKPDKKEQIMEAAEQLFAASGFHATSVRDICSAADVNVAMVNYYFGSKEGLFRELVEHRASFMRGKLEALLADKSLSSIAKLEIAIEHFVNRMFSYQSFTLCVIREMSKSGDDPLRRNMSGIFLNNMKLMKELIEQGIRKKEFRKVDVGLTIATLMGSIWNMISTGALILPGLDDDSAGKYTHEELRIRLTKHLHQLIQNHLLIPNYGTDKSK